MKVKVSMSIKAELQDRDSEWADCSSNKGNYWIDNTFDFGYSGPDWNVSLELSIEKYKKF